jgi:hypothetical protein
LPPWEGADPFPLSLTDALQVGARNSREYQTRKEAVFLAALDLDLERNSFRTITAGSADVLAEANLESGADDGVEAGADASFSRLLKNGALLAGAIGIDLVKLLSSALGVFGDLSASIPLLRGAGKHVVLEPLTQAERDVVYALREFERFRHTFAVGVASDYLEVLRLLDRVRNAEENCCARATTGSRRSRRTTAASTRSRSRWACRRTRASRCSGTSSTGWRRSWGSASRRRPSRAGASRPGRCRRRTRRSSCRRSTR